MSESILIVDDESGVRASLSGILGDEGYSVETADSGEDCLTRLARGHHDLVLLDVWLPGMDGLTTLSRVRELEPDLPIVMISGHGTIETAVKAVRLGALDFIEKPLSLEKTLVAVRNALHQRRLEWEVRSLRREVEQKWLMVGESPAICGLRADIMRAAPSHGRALIFGENGTGKELVARNIHLHSRRSSGPFIEVNCAAIPEELIESELFGHARGAFTGAHMARKGKFEQADGGTLFLDEVGDMSLKTQAKVLRALQEQRVEPLGGGPATPIDVRVIAATNKDLLQQIEKRLFRDDLFFRLNVIPFHVPPLRERRSDIPLLARHFVARLALEYGRRPKELTTEALGVLSALPWPGNVRELHNVIERLFIMSPGERIRAEDVPQPSFSRPEPPAPCVPQKTSGATLAEARDAFERQHIWKTYQACGGNMSRTAEALKVERSNLYRKMKAFGLLPLRKSGATRTAP
ncbi:MAG: sigma-54-dependent Fis family transcriptional regulator [Vicinamibacteria bacterium]|nr:sigma-54-dependent Fis family transcriptional regulator [Vicinamibacteria bacterium]